MVHYICKKQDYCYYNSVKLIKSVRFKTILKNLAITALVIWAINWGFFIYISIKNNGDAIYGYQIEHKYLLGKRDFLHGGFTYHETDKISWYISKYTGFGLPTVTVLALVSFFYLIKIRK